MKRQFPSWTLKKHDQVTQEYKRYLILILTHGNVAPSSDVDEMWHTHIWSSRNYVHDCSQVLWRKFIHHAPERKPGPKSRSAKSFKNTLDKYKEVFGEAAPQDIWGKKRTTTKGSRMKKNLCHKIDSNKREGTTNTFIIRVDEDCSWSCDSGDPWTPSCAECCGNLYDGLKISDCTMECKDCNPCRACVNLATSTLVDCYEGCTPCFPGKEGNDWNEAKNEENFRDCDDSCWMQGNGCDYYD